DASEVDPLRVRQRFAEDLRAADNHDFAYAPGCRDAPRFSDCSGKGWPDDDALGGKGWVAAQYNIVASVERLADRDECPPAHDHRFAHRNPPEDPQIRRDPPRQPSAATDHV